MNLKLNLKLNPSKKLLVSLTVLYLAFIGFLSVVYAADWASHWTWNVTVEEIAFGHYSDEACTVPVATLNLTSVNSGHNVTSWILNEGTCPITLTIGITSSEDWATVAHDYAGEPILVGAKQQIVWTLIIIDEHPGENVSVTLTVVAEKA